MFNLFPRGYWRSKDNVNRQEGRTAKDQEVSEDLARGSTEDPQQAARRFQDGKTTVTCFA